MNAAHDHIIEAGGGTMDDMMDMLTVAEAARELGLTARGIQERIRRGAMRARPASPRLWLIPRSEVERMRPLGRLPAGRKRKAQNP